MATGKADAFTSANILRIGPRHMRKLKPHEITGQTCDWVFDDDGEMVSTGNQQGNVWRPSTCKRKAAYVSRPSSVHSLFYCEKHMRVLWERM